MTVRPYSPVDGEKKAKKKEQQAPKAIDKSLLAYPKPRRVRDREHVRFVAKQPCLICGRQPADAHHLRFMQSRALGRKVSDEFTVPLCRVHHRELHRHGDEARWWKNAGINPSSAARALWLETHPILTETATEMVTTVAWGLAFFRRIRDNGAMARRGKPTRQHTGLYYAREARGISRTELVKRSGVSKQQLSRLENGLIRLRLDHLKPFAGPLGYTPEQILLWGRYPGTGSIPEEVSERRGKPLLIESRPGEVLELARQSAVAGERRPSREIRKDGRHADPIKPERWSFPSSFMKEQLHTSPERLLVVEAEGDSMAPTVSAGDRVIVDTGHKEPTPDGLYAIRDALKSVVVRRLQLLRGARPTRVKIIPDNRNHAPEEVPIDELEIVGKVLCCLKLI